MLQSTDIYVFYPFNRVEPDRKRLSVDNIDFV